MTVYIIYKCGRSYIKELCCKSADLTQLNVFIPHIGETFLDMTNKVEYEVQDIIRSYNSDDNEYGIQIILNQRKINKYKVK